MKQPQGPTVALHYDGHGAPRVTAKGDGEIARQILATAHQHGIPIYRDETLSRVLSQVELDAAIPMALYVAVAEVIAFAYRLKDKTPPAPAPQARGRTFDHGKYE